MKMNKKEAKAQLQQLLTGATPETVEDKVRFVPICKLAVEVGREQDVADHFGISKDAVTRAAKDGTPRVVELAMDLIRMDPALQPRVSLDEETIKEYAELAAVGESMPPIITFFDGETYWPGDGWHRYHGRKRAGKLTILAEVREGTRRDAILYAAGANAKHGLKRSNADKHRAVSVLLADPVWQTWSDGKIARQCGVSDRFVSKIRPKVAPSTNGSEIRTFERGGKVIQMDVTKIGQKAGGGIDGAKPEDPKDGQEDQGKEQEATVDTGAFGPVASIRDEKEQEADGADAPAGVADADADGAGDADADDAKNGTGANDGVTTEPMPAEQPKPVTEEGSVAPPTPADGGTADTTESKGEQVHLDNGEPPAPAPAANKVPVAEVSALQSNMLAEEPCMQTVLLRLTELLDLSGVYAEPEERSEMAQLLFRAWANRDELLGQLRRAGEFISDLMAGIEKFAKSKEAKKAKPDVVTLGSVLHHLRELGLHTAIASPGKAEPDSGWALAFPLDADVKVPTCAEGVIFDLRLDNYHVVAGGDLPYHVRGALNRLLEKIDNNEQQEGLEAAG